jgi:hypothetical protein
MIYVETSTRLLIWQSRIKLIDRYEFVPVGFPLEIGRLVKVLKFLNKCDFIPCKRKIINDSSRIKAFNFRWNEKFICQIILSGGGGNDSHSTSDKSEEKEEVGDDIDLNYEEIEWESEVDHDDLYDRYYRKWNQYSYEFDEHNQAWCTKKFIGKAIMK